MSKIWFGLGIVASFFGVAALARAIEAATLSQWWSALAATVAMVAAYTLAYLAVRKWRDALYTEIDKEESKTNIKAE